MRRALLVAVALLAAVTLLAACVPEPPGVGPQRKHVVNKHNKKRAKFGIAPLTKHKPAIQNAQVTANRISGESGGGCVLNHTSSQQLLAWYNTRVAENIACVWGCIDSGAGFKAFWQSPPHRANILDAGFRWIAVGIQCNGPMAYFAIHYF